MPYQGVTYEGLVAETINFRGDNGDLINGYLARPNGSGPYPTIINIHHMPGWDKWIHSLTRDFASEGFVTLAPNFHFREEGVTPQDRSDSIRSKGGMPDSRTMADLAAAIETAKNLPYTNGKIGIIGYCSGGRQVYLAACTLSGIDAAVDCWGGGVITPDSELTPAQPVSPHTFSADLSCPLMGVFGNDDARPSPEEVNETEALLKQHNKNYEFHRYDGAGHGFLARDRDSYRQHAAVDVMPKILEFFNKNLA
ncbi:MAG: carboxymethylenebutenolidase [Dehalococcoidia bacterium]|nr:carboxymethylenebutenolidase [Dehalococcoidia bacterium]MQG26089.1 dienelactone hydrolase family protein [SAR202 cluster bacterium]MQG52155.1 dienelactone hydrolase family protein [SAR202 cluster bacterium]|tara:strand:+ start:2522 stop:3280 length:759 start_codon:yes stop_codon:yes gene_type:complete